MNKHQKGFTSVVIALIILFLAVAGGVSYYLINQKNQNLDNLNQNQTACTEEAKICPDGSSVGRVGPDCEFEECPEVIIQEENIEETTGEASIKAAYFIKDSFNFNNKTFKVITLGNKLSSEQKLFEIKTTDKTKIYKVSDGENTYWTFVEFANMMINDKNEAFDVEDPNLVYVYGGYRINGTLLSNNTIEASEIFMVVQ